MKSRNKVICYKKTNDFFFKEKIKLTTVTHTFYKDFFISRNKRTNSVDEDTFKKTTHYLSVDVSKNNDKLDHLLESGVVNIGLLKEDGKHDSKTDKRKKID